MNSRQLVRTSKLLSRVLRHAPEHIGITLDRAGWVAVDDLLAALARSGKPLSRTELEEVVATDDKQRFAFSEDGGRIRASQGHSIEIDLGLKPVAPPELLFHGTVAKAVAAILASGLTPQTRQYVHLSPDVETARKVGSRRGKPVILRVAAGHMHQERHVFYRSANGVWLTSAVPPDYIEVLSGR